MSLCPGWSETKTNKQKTQPCHLLKASQGSVTVFPISGPGDQDASSVPRVDPRQRPDLGWHREVFTLFPGRVGLVPSHDPSSLLAGAKGTAPLASLTGARTPRRSGSAGMRLPRCSFLWRTQALVRGQVSFHSVLGGL